MKFFEKAAVGGLISALTGGFALYGVWEDKALLSAPLLILVYLSAAGWIFGKIRTRTLGGLPVPPAGIPLLLFWLYSCAWVPFAELPYEAVISSVGLGAYVSIYWVTTVLLSRFSSRKAVWMTVLTLLIGVALYSLVQHRTVPNLIYGIERYTDSWQDGRLGGTYQCPNHIAHLFQMWLPLCTVFLLIPRFGWFWRICSAYALLLFLLLIYQTQSRAGLLGAVAALGATALLLILRKSRRLFYIALLIVPLLGALTIGGLWAGSPVVRARMQPVGEFVRQCLSGDFQFTDSRPQAWLDTLPMIAERPLFGFGPGSYGAVYEKYRERVLAVRIEMVHAHNEYLELLAEYGFVGGLLVLWVLISISVRMIRFIRTAERPYHALPAAALLGALAGTAVHGFFDFELRIFPNAMMLALLAGCAAAPLTQTVPERFPRTAAVIQWIFALSVAASACWSLQVMSSVWIRSEGDRLLSKQKFSAAQKYFLTAAKIDPQNWPAHLGLGQIYYQRRYYELDPARKQEWAQKEKEAYESARQLNNMKEEISYGLGRVELFLGNRDAGLDYLRQAANYKRFNDFYWRKLGIELRRAGLYEEALTAFEYAQKLDRSNKTVKRNIEWLKQKLRPGGLQPGTK